MSPNKKKHYKELIEHLLLSTAILLGVLICVIIMNAIITYAGTGAVVVMFVVISFVISDIILFKYLQKRTNHIKNKKNEESY